ncbi:hypothetical protein [Caldisphaera lagunensis]
MQCIKEGKVILGDEAKEIRELFTNYKNKYGSILSNGKEIVYLKDKIEIPGYDKGVIKKANVLAIAKMPKEKLIRITLDDGNVFDVTRNHKFITNLGEISSEQIASLYKNNEILVKRVENFENKIIKRRYKFKKGVLMLSSPIFWYLTGLVLGGKIYRKKGRFYIKEKIDESFISLLPIKKMKKSKDVYQLELYFVDWLIKNGFIEIKNKK